MGDPPRFRLLGPVQVYWGGSELDLGGPLQRALLACLLLNVGRVVSREQLIDALWDVAPPPRAARSLETKVSRLRATLGEGATLVARGGGYVLEAPRDEIDVQRFEHALAEARALRDDDPRAARAQLEAALALWQGDALGGVPEGVLSVERARLEDARVEALGARIDADLALGEGASLVSELQGLRSAHPAREQFTEQLMLALYRSGRQAEALGAYRATYRELRDELGIEPGPRLRELEQAILRHDESLGPLPLRARLVGASRRRWALALAAIGGGVLLVVVLLASSGGQPHRRGALRPGLILVDAASGTVRADVPVGDSQGVTRFGYGHFWTLGENGVMSEVDPHDGSLVRTIPVGVQFGGLAVGAGGIWGTDRNGPTLLRIDPVTGRINLRARLSNLGLRRPEPNMGIAIDAGSLWVARGPEAVDRLDPSSLKLQRRIMLGQRGCEGGSGGAQCAVAAGAGRVWVAGGLGGWLARIDEATDRVTVFKGLRPYLCCVAVGGASVWVAEAHDIARLAPDGRVLRRYPFSSDGIGEMAYDNGSLWASADTTGQLLRIDARTGRLRSIHLGNLLISASASRGMVAVSALPLPTIPTRGLGRRVLRVGLDEDWLNTTDPAVTRAASGTGRWQWQLHRAICAELYTRPEGAGGRTLVPELASGPARTSPDARTWTIPIRTDLRFSPPLNRAVTPEDVRATLIRALSPELGPAAPAAHILRDVVGLPAYRRGRTNDVSGIRLRNGALQITTRRRVRDLPARLALPYFCVVPAGTPTPPGGYQDPLPTAGPYYLAAHEGGVLAVVRANPGYGGPRRRRLDGLIFHMNLSDQAGAAKVHRGQLDYFDGGSGAAVNARVGCRASQSGIPGLDLAALCLRSLSG
jgi:DNA-binding SARP family transcriptional activator/streptogramin lyase